MEGEVFKIDKSNTKLVKSLKTWRLNILGTKMIVSKEKIVSGDVITIIKLLEEFLIGRSSQGLLIMLHRVHNTRLVY